MKLTAEQLAELKALAKDVRSLANGCGSQRSFERMCEASEAIPALIADLEEAQLCLSTSKATIQLLTEQRDALHAKLAAAEKGAELSDIALMKAYSRSNNGEQLSPGERVRFLRYARIAIAAQEGK